MFRSSEAWDNAVKLVRALFERARLAIEMPSCCRGRSPLGMGSIAPSCVRLLRESKSSGTAISAGHGVHRSNLSGPRLGPYRHLVHQPGPAGGHEVEAHI